MDSLGTEASWIREQQDAAKEEMERWDRELIQFLDKVEQDTVVAREKEEMALGYKR